MSFDLQPILKGELLELRPLRAEDFPHLYAVAADPLTWEQHPSKDRYKVFKVFFRDAMESGVALIAVDAKDGQVIQDHLSPFLQICKNGKNTRKTHNLAENRPAILALRLTLPDHLGDSLGQATANGSHIANGSNIANRLAMLLLHRKALGAKRLLRTNRVTLPHGHVAHTFSAIRLLPEFCAPALSCPT